MCLSEALCINEFKFFLIYSQQGRQGFNGIKEPVDGILGMCRGMPPEMARNKKTYEVGPLYVDNLKRQGITQANIFSFFLADPDQVSFVDFNGFASDRIKDKLESEIVWLKIKDDFYWSTGL